MFRDWGPALAPGIEVCPVSLPGREDRLAEPPFTRLKPLVDALARELVPHMSTPTAFFGHSLGAVVAFEVARMLRSWAGLLPVHLFVSASHAPQSPNRQKRLHQLPRAALVRELRRFDGTPAELLESEEFIELMLPTMRADLAMVETYVYQDDVELECPISVFGGIGDRTVHPEDLLAWRVQAADVFALRTYPGGHFFLHEAQPAVLSAITSDLIRSVQVNANRTSGGLVSR